MTGQGLGGGSSPADDVVDVAVVGAGPVGLTLAALLGQAGRSVVVLERYPGLYGLPRAASFDGEILRLLAGLGLVEELWPTLHVQTAYQWSDAAGEILVNMESRLVGDSGWPDMVMFHQPVLEQALHARCASLPMVEVRLGAAVTGLEQTEEGVRLATAEGGTVRARYVVACDGGNSFVRAALGIDQDDLDFAEPWLVCDFKLGRPADELGLPSALQIGDPEEPTTIITTGAGHQRFCFMLDEADVGREFSDGETWQRVKRYLTPADADLVRVATYTFRSLIARRWRDRRVLLAGDAAHQMPPFLGQGMCSGMRDAANLAFKLDLVLAGVRETDVLDTYQSEREPHVRTITETSMALGRQHTLTDPELARQRDDRLRARRDSRLEPERIRLPDLGPGLHGPGGGTRSVQGRVDDGQQVGLRDQVVGGGFRLLVREDSLAGVDVPALRAAGVTVIVIGELAGNGVVADVDGTLHRWFDHLGAAAIAERPDHYVLAAGPDANEVAHELLASCGRVASGCRAASSTGVSTPCSA
ncbi:bifunctional 3-(3-hydroxy-phenyl)propionate/3-hydroxycinnamic acid hydroxylase [Kutzneria sp. CA-103260]|uniref:bifunctional 3-(3-hydroxy-phenyl)propionate/3-hydroxycinnamic acid hydroxylase n=1 Tax=Kutzneria sp. CA-103260 TaxID=2802641 RepID=UPI001BA7A8A8|nr:bifunctional 3-(3-hydroxy-phenyl)propionate/3-hydroxycinnamic acid hydroxylase [Kutzneria sp. CA-103260]QUQ64774.1 3-(3-hydroxyphenyl)propionate hydroxylase [Kutzneria sp. CA-103260]